MVKLTLFDRLQLVKAGYKAKQIEEMIIKDASETPASEGDADPEPAKEPEKEPGADEKEDTPDYKKMFEEMQSKNTELTEQLKAAQEANIQKDASGSAPKLTGQEAVNEIFKNVIF